MNIITGIALGAFGVAVIEAAMEKIKARRRRTQLNRATHPQDAAALVRRNRRENAKLHELFDDNQRQYADVVRGR